jgi:hypothetical protein
MNTWILIFDVTSIFMRSLIRYYYGPNNSFFSITELLFNGRLIFAKSSMIVIALRHFHITNSIYIVFIICVLLIRIISKVTRTSISLPIIITVILELT